MLPILRREHVNAGHGVLWNKQIAFQHRTAYIEEQGIASDTKRLCKNADSIGPILGSCTYSEVKKVYISRHDIAMRLIVKRTRR